MPVLDTKDIFETIPMIQDDCLDVRTTTMGISLLDCACEDMDRTCQRVYDKICRLAKDLVQTGEEIQRQYGIPIINKRIAVTPIAMIAGPSGGDPVKLALTLQRAARDNRGGTVFGCRVNDPRPFGVVEFDKDGRAISIEEKPRYPKSNYIIPGLYFYDHQVMEIANQLKPSARGELEITDLNRIYLEEGSLKVIPLGRGYAWLDTGTVESLSEASEFVRVIESREGIQISAPEEIAYRNGWITRERLEESAAIYGKSPYGQHLRNVAGGKYMY